MKKEEVENDVKQYADLEAVASSKGGQRIASGLKKDIISLIDQLCSLCKKGGQYNEIIAIGIQIDEKLNMYKIFTNAPINLSDANKALEDILKPEKEES